MLIGIYFLQESDRYLIRLFSNCKKEYRQFENPWHSSKQILRKYFFLLTFEEMPIAKVFSTFDANKVFWQIQLCERKILNLRRLILFLLDFVLWECHVVFVLRLMFFTNLFLTFLKILKLLKSSLMIFWYRKKLKKSMI